MRDQAVKKQYFTIFLDLPGKLYVHNLFVTIFMKIVNYFFVYSRKSVVNIA